MSTVKNNDEIFNLEIGNTIDWKFGLITREIYRVNKNKFEINETCGTWITANVTLNTMKQLLTGEKNILELNWK